jgi:hypothetical protein
MSALFRVYAEICVALLFVAISLPLSGCSTTKAFIDACREGLCR